MVEVIISGDSLAKEVKLDLARFPNSGAAWGLDSELFETGQRQGQVKGASSVSHVVLDCGATETAGGVEAVQILVDAVNQAFLILSLKWTDRGFVLPLVTGAGLSQESGC